MRKKFLITEEEKNTIKKLYNITEIDAAKAIEALAKFVGSSKEKETEIDGNDVTDYDNLSTPSGDNWMDVTRKVIRKFEGGYWNPSCSKYPGTKHPPKSGIYSKSSETMFGLDREAGNIENISSDGKKFFELIDNEKQKLGEENFCKKWKWNYIPEEPLKSELIDLAAKTMKKQYDDNAFRYFKGKTKDIVEGSKPLLLHFSYATWNGPGFFKDFAQNINDGVAQGKSIRQLVKIAKEDRKRRLGGTAWASATEKVNAAIDDEAIIDNVG